jgi:acyl-coenzyme A thioesterase PaaI-like protein
MKQTLPAPEANHCFVCGKSNPIGLKLTFRMDQEVCRSEFTPDHDHCGWSETTHGGIIYSVLDDVMANWLFLKGIAAHTARCQVRYRAPLPTGVMVVLEGRLISRRGRLAVLDGRMLRNDNAQLIAESEASFLIEQP